MKTTPIRFLACLLLPAAMLTGTYALADGHEAPPPVIAESFICSYNDGQGHGDLMAARDSYVNAVKSEGLNAPNAFLWTMFKGAAPIDTVWFNIHENMSAFGRWADAFGASEDLMAATAGFNSVATCQTGLGVLYPTFNRESAADDDVNNTTTINSLACNLRGSGGIGDLTAHAHSVFSAMGDKAPVFSARIEPLTGNASTPDMYLFSVFPNTEAYGDFIMALNTSEEGQGLLRHLNSVVDCNTALFAGQQVVSSDG